MTSPDQTRYRFYLQADPAPMLGIVLMSALGLVAGFGVPVFVLASIILFVRDQDLATGALALGLGLCYLPVAIFSWSVVRSLRLRRRHRANIYIATTDTDFIYQDYDIEDRLQRQVIPKQDIREIEYVSIPSHDPDAPDTHLIRIHYRDRQGQRQHLDISYFFGRLQEGSLIDVLRRELKQQPYD